MVIVLKIIGWVLLGVLAIIAAVCLASVKITVGIKDGFYWRLSVFGIPLPMRLFFKSEKDDKGKRGKGDKKDKKKKRLKKSKGEKIKEKEEPEKEKKPIGEVLSLVSELVGEAVRTVPRAFRIRLHYLDITVGGEEAAEVAINYGRLYAITEGLLAALDSYKGMLHGFKTDRRKISLSTDYTGAKTTAKFKLTVSCFVWQLLNVAVRIGIKYFVYALKNGERE